MNCEELPFERVIADISAHFLQSDTNGIDGKIKRSHEEIVGEGTAIKAMLAQAEQVAETDAGVLILGEVVF